MVDNISKEHRSWNMSRIRSKDTSPEVRVRSFLHREGFRFRLHFNDLPGRPDIVLPKYNTAIFVHGCYWHRHPDCKFAYSPKTHIEFWQEKFKQNVLRDQKNETRLLKSGWRVLTVWECETVEKLRLSAALKNLLERKTG